MTPKAVCISIFIVFDLQPTIKQDFQLLVCCLMAGHSLALDTLTKHNPKLLVTMEDYLWAKLSLVHSGPQVNWFMLD